MTHIPRIYLPDVTVDENRSLNPALAHHLGRVLRLRDGAAITIFDGKGHEFEAHLLNTEHGTGVRIGTLARTEVAPRLAIELWVAISRRTRMEWTLEKAVELGVSAIRPVISERSKVRLNDKQGARKLEHWQAIVTAATAQSGRAWLPTLSPPQPLDALWERVPCETRLFLSPDADDALASLSPAQGHLALLVGPESGFSEHECLQARDTGWQPVRLGPRILRAETAGPAALAAIQVLWGDWRQDSSVVHTEHAEK
ncbi:MAG: 16S rRNA (uracil(1498)-N(3))-methyltransferase [Gammaproteobacteria bacterium]